MTPPAARAARGLVAALILIAVLFAAALIAHEPPRPPRGELPPTAFSSARALAVLRDLVGNSIPHPMGSAANSALRARIVAQLERLDYEPQLQTGAFVCDPDAWCGTPANIVVRIPGAQDDAPAVLLAAHYDSVPAGPGASDDGTGVAAVLEIARILKALPRTRHPIVLLIDDGEEAGLLGARAFVEYHPLGKTIAAAVNIDNRGTSGPSLMFETGSANRWLIHLYSQGVVHPASNSLYYSMYKLLPNDTDFTVFKSAGYQGFNFANIGDVANYHTPRDDFAHVSAASLQEHGENALAVLLALARADSAAPPPGEAVYFDLFGRVIVSVPQELMLPTAVGTMLLVLGTATVLIRRAQVRLREMAWALGGLALAYVAAVLLAIGLIFWVRAVNPARMPQFSASPWVLQGTCAAAVATLLCALSLGLSKRVRFCSFWSANAVWTSLFALLLAVKLPGTSYLVLLPAIAGLIAMLLQLVAGPGGRQPVTATLGYELVAFTVLWPILIDLYAGLGRPSLPLLILLPVIAAAPLVGLLMRAGRVVPRAAAGVSVLCLLTGAAAAAMMPAYTVNSPQALNIHYVEEHTGTGSVPRAHWLISDFTRALGPELRQQLPFAPVQRDAINPLLILQRYEFMADAPRLELAAPALTVATVTAVQAATDQPPRLRYALHISPNATVSSLQIALSVRAQLSSVRIGNTAVSLTAWDDNWSVISAMNPPPSGLDLSFEAADVPFDIDLANVTYGLPPAGLKLLQARPSNSTAIEGGDDTRILTTLQLPKDAVRP